MKRGSWILLSCVALLLVMAAAYFIGSASTNQHRLAARATLDERVVAAQAAVEKRKQTIAADRPEAPSTPIANDALQALLDAMDTANGRGSEWHELTVAMKEAGAAWPPELLARVQTWMDAQAGLIAQARAFAANGAELPGPDRTLPTGGTLATGDLDHVHGLHDLNRVLLAYAHTLSAQGKTDEAMRVLDDTIALANLTGSQEFILSQLMRASEYGATLDEVAGVMSGHALSAEQLDALDRRLESAHQREPFAAAVCVETQLGVGFFDDLRDNTLGRLLSPLMNMNETSFVESMAELSAVASQPYHDAAASLTSISDGAANLPFTHALSRSLLASLQPALVRAIEGQAQHEASIDLARIAIALERHYLETGDYPESLDALAPAFDGALPSDPFSGGNFIYHPGESAYLLYSVGIDLDDDGGSENPRNGDIVWGQP